MSGYPAVLLSTRNEVLNVERGGFEAKWRAHALVEGCSIRSTERLTGVHRDTITKLVLSLGRACDRLMQEQIRHVRCPDLQLDELWCYVGKKRAHVRHTDDASKVGDFWTWYGIDRDSKLVPHFHVGSARKMMPWSSPAS